MNRREFCTGAVSVTAVAGCTVLKPTCSLSRATFADSDFWWRTGGGVANRRSLSDPPPFDQLVPAWTTQIEGTFQDAVRTEHAVVVLSSIEDSVVVTVHNTHDGETRLRTTARKLADTEWSVSIHHVALLDEQLVIGWTFSEGGPPTTSVWSGLTVFDLSRGVIEHRARFDGQGIVSVRPDGFAVVTNASSGEIESRGIDATTGETCWTTAPCGLFSLDSPEACDDVVGVHRPVFGDDSCHIPIETRDAWYDLQIDFEDGELLGSTRVTPRPHRGVSATDESLVFSATRPSGPTIRRTRADQARAIYARTDTWVTEWAIGDEHVFVDDDGIACHNLSTLERQWREPGMVAPIAVPGGVVCAAPTDEQILSLEGDRTVVETHEVPGRPVDYRLDRGGLLTVLESNGSQHLRLERA